ncbi:TPA: hypothetical protein ACLG1F_000668 [Pseudomonas aeruginosa]|uniref:hypothetical protein n=1 Tax=Pseudomonas aeruginosa TaxID=287 RepID=UPI001CD99B61|nr:hypothetical protein [Pseudomonas aeruginosa]
MSSTQHQLIEQCATRLRGIVEALDNIHDTSPHRWSTDLDDVHSSAESLLALIKDQAPTQAAQGLAGAALAQPSPALPPFAEKVLAKLRRFYDCASDFESGGVDIGRHWLDLLTQLGLLNRVQRSPALWEISQQGEDLLGMPQPSPAQAEAERPEVVGYRSKESGMVYEQDYGLKNPEALTTVAECERIVGALRAENAKLSEALDRWPLIRDSLKLRLADALARVAELERQEPVALANRGLHAFWVKWTEAAAGLYGPGIKLYAAPVAQAQHSVPEGLALIPVRETEAMHDAVMALLYKGVARTDTQKLLDAYIAAAPGNSVPQAWLDVQAERRRQITAEGWTPEHDDEHADGQMARAAACYALAGSSAPNDGTAALLVSLAWPWDEQWWKPSTPRRDLVKACALALAEIERLDRAGISQSPQPGATTASS